MAWIRIYKQKKHISKILVVNLIPILRFQVMHDYVFPGGGLNFELGTDVQPEVLTTTL